VGTVFIFLIKAYFGDLTLSSFCSTSSPFNLNIEFGLNPFFVSLFFGDIMICLGIFDMLNVFDLNVIILLK